MMAQRFADQIPKAALALAIWLAVTTAQAQIAAIFSQPSDRVINPSPYVSQLYPVADTDPARSVARQAALGGNVLLWLGLWPQAANNFAATLAEAKKYPGTFTYVYLVSTHTDEIFWCGTHVCIGENEDLLIAGAQYAHTQGFKTLCTFLPDVVLDPGFRLRDLTMCDAIGFDIYPAIRPTQPDMRACWVADNITANLLNCSVRKMRSLGYQGDLGLIYQGFCLRSDSQAKCKKQLLDQRDVLDNLEDFGVRFSVPWGMHLGADLLAREPDLVPLGGTRLERLVRP